MAQVLIIDDDRGIRQLLRRIIATRGHMIVEADSGRTGVEAFRQQAFDLVLTDIVMPDMDGNQTIVQLRKLNPDIRIVAVSGGGRARNLTPLQLAKQFGADRILEKPFRRDDVVRMVDEILAGGQVPPPAKDTA
jgi:CheY-like chemotaxis protein